MDAHRRKPLLTHACAFGVTELYGDWGKVTTNHNGLLDPDVKFALDELAEALHATGCLLQSVHCTALQDAERKKP